MTAGRDPSPYAGRCPVCRLLLTSASRARLKAQREPENEQDMLELARLYMRELDVHRRGRTCLGLD
jgi:hypothetical protein